MRVKIVFPSRNLENVAHTSSPLKIEENDCKIHLHETANKSSGVKTKKYDGRGSRTL
jgi:hypothetical protein